MDQTTAWPPREQVVSRLVARAQRQAALPLAHDVEHAARVVVALDRDVARADLDVAQRRGQVAGHLQVLVARRGQDVAGQAAHLIGYYAPALAANTRPSKSSPKIHPDAS